MPNDPSDPRQPRHRSRPSSDNYGATTSPFTHPHVDLLSNTFADPITKTELLRIQAFLDSTQKKKPAKFWFIDASKVTSSNLPDDFLNILRGQFELFLKKDTGGKAIVILCAEGSSLLMLVRSLTMSFPQTIRVCTSPDHVQQQLALLRANFT